MQIALPGSAGCFSFLQNALNPSKKRVKITPEVHDQLLDFQWLANNVAHRPTHLAEVVLTPPIYFGAMDASKLGMGGVWFPPRTPLPPFSIQPPVSARLKHPILWRSPFPASVQSQLVSMDNPRGKVTNSDLELAGSIAHDDVLCQALPSTPHISTCTFSDNTPAVAWKAKGSTSTTGPAAYLLQTAALHRRHHRYQNEMHFIPGSLNTMADDCSRLWSLTDSQLVDYFNTHYPQQRTWKMHHLTTEMSSALTLNLQRERSPPASFLLERQKPSQLGTFGSRSARPLTSTPIFRQWPTLLRYSKSLDCVGEMDASHPVATPTELARLRMPSAWSARGFPAWGPKTPGWTTLANKTFV